MKITHERNVNKFVVVLSRRFVLCTIVCAVFGAFGVGIGCRFFVRTTTSKRRKEHDTHPFVSNSQIHGEIARDTVYSNKIFDSEIAALASLESTLLGHHIGETKIAEVEGNDNEEDNDEDDGDVNDQAHHESSGYHLSMDIHGVDTSMLGSKKRLQSAMMQLADDAQIALLSYHCSSHPAWKSCIGISLHSHVSFQTWPEDGVLALDIFSQGQQSMKDLLPMIEKVFIDKDLTKPEVRWGMRKRGFRHATRVNPEEVDIEQFLLARKDVEHKQPVVSSHSDYQQVEIYDVTDPRRRPWLKTYAGLRSKDYFYEVKHPELFRPDRVLYLDSILQSRLFGEAAYHEALVHPAMFSHPNPKRVAIIGGGEGATLREVLKHNTVEEVTMIEIDSKVVEMSRQYLPEWVDCSDFIGSTSCCLDDPRADIIYEDAIAWFVDRYSDSEERNSNSFDVIIMDALDPESVVEFSDLLYNNTDFLRALSNALSDIGILVVQTGEQNELDDPPPSASGIDRAENFIKGLQRMGFQHISTYYEAHGGFLGVWDFLIGFKQKSIKKYWYSNEAELELRMKECTISTISGKPPFRFFDGATMVGYEHPSKVEQKACCRNKPPPPLCEQDQDDGNPLTNVSPRDAPTVPEYSFDDILFMPSTHALIQNMSARDFSGLLQPLHVYETEHGFISNFFGTAAIVVDPAFPVSGEATRIERTLMESNPIESYVFNPFIERNYMRYLKTIGSENKGVE